MEKQGSDVSEHKVVSFDSIKVACRNCSLATLCLPMGLTPEDVDQMDSIDKRDRPLHRGDQLFRQGDPFSCIYVVKTGTVKSFDPGEDGSEQVLGFHLPGELIGLDAIESGFYSSVMIDASSKPFEENLALSQQVVAMA